MFKSNDGILLEDCLISFLLISTFLILMSSLLTDVYRIKNDLVTSSAKLNDLKSCLLVDCELSSGYNVRTNCAMIQVGHRQEEVCLEI